MLSILSGVGRSDGIHRLPGENSSCADSAFAKLNNYQSYGIIMCVAESISDPDSIWGIFFDSYNSWEGGIHSTCQPVQD